MIDLIGQIFVFGFGIFVGTEISRREKPTTYHLFGKHIGDICMKVMAHRRWTGPGCEISVTEKLNIEGRDIEIVVREMVK